MRRIGIVSFMHESNTFNKTLTKRAMFENTALHYGDQIVCEWAEAHHEVGGMLEMLPVLGLTPIPLLAAAATPAGPLCQDVYEGILGEILQRIAGETLDGLLLSLHGAMVAEHIRDADGETASRIRRLTGPNLPIVMTLDLHANVSPRMIAHVTAITAYRSNPHLDQRERGREAALILSDVLEGKTRPVQALEKPPLLIPILAQKTACEPVVSLYAHLRALIAQPGVISASIALGFPYADVEEMGASFLVVSDEDEALARREACALAQRAWNLRDQGNVTGMPVADAVQEAGQASETPVTLLDVGDNVGGGSPGDGTVIFEDVLRAGVDRALVILYDPEAVRACVAAGVGEQISLEVGGKRDALHGRPVFIRGRVRLLHDGLFAERQVRHGGKLWNNQGLTAVVDTAEGHLVVLNSLPMAPFSLEQVLSLGIKPEQMRVLIAKGAIAPRAAYEPISARVIEVDSPGITSPNPKNFTFKYRRRPMYPFEPETEYLCQEDSLERSGTAAVKGNSASQSRKK